MCLHVKNNIFLKGATNENGEGQEGGKGYILVGDQRGNGFWLIF
jgi:hypothetical protein